MYINSNIRTKVFLSFPCIYYKSNISMKKDSKKRLFEVMQRVAPNFTGKALNESPITTVTNDAGEPIGTEYQPDSFDPQDDDERQDGPEKQPQGIGNFNSIDWQMLHEQLMINTELQAAHKTSDGNLMTANVGDFTDNEGMLSPDELKLLEAFDLVYVHDGLPIIEEDKYKDYNTFKAKAQEIWNKEIRNYHEPSSHGGGFEPMYGESVAEQTSNKKYMDDTTVAKVISTLIDAKNNIQDIFEKLPIAEEIPEAEAKILQDAMTVLHHLEVRYSNENHGIGAINK
jgi:hypothetical protein